MATALQDRSLQIQYDDPPPEYKAYEEAPALEAQVTPPAAAVVTETRGIAAAGTNATAPDSNAWSAPNVTNTTNTSNPPQPPPIPESTGAASLLSTVLWLALAAYFFAAAGRADLSTKKERKQEFWCHSHNGGNLVTIVILVFFGIFVLMFWEARKKGWACAIWPVAVWGSLLVGMGIRGSVCGNWGSV